MKRLLPMILLLLLLTGCAAGNTAETAAPTENTQAPTAPAVQLYDPDSAAEAATGGAVRAYPLGDGDYTGIYPMGEKLLVQSADGVLTLLQGEEGQVAATVLTQLSQEGSRIAVSDSFIYCYYPDSRVVVTLDSGLQEQQRVKLPEEAQSGPVLQATGQVFYCVGSDIRAFDLASGVSRLVRQHSCTAQTLTGSFFDDTVIGCRLEDESGSVTQLYLSAETGEKFPSDTGTHTFYTGGSWYFGVCPENTDHPYVYGTREGETMCLYPREDTLLPVLEAGGVAGAAVNAEGLKLSFYDLSAACRTAEITIPDAGLPEAVASTESYVYMISQGVLYRWTVADTPVADDSLYTGLRYTASQPDTAGIADCKLRAQSLRDAYGLNLYLWDDAEDGAGEYCQTEEHRVSVMTAAMDDLEEMVSTFPEGFLSKAGVSFYLVGSLPDGANKAQFWDAGGCHVVLTGEDTLKSFLWGLGFAIDTYVLNHCREFDNWDDLNPSGFRYTYDYEENALREDWEEDLDCFIDLESMSFPTEDRSRIFVYALLPEGAEYFRQRDLQDKLEQVCEAIREAYEWERSSEVYPWEQYLEDPLAREA